MNHQPERIFQELYKARAVAAGNFGISTTAYYSDVGWVNAEQVLRTSFEPLLSASQRILLAGYRTDWLSDRPIVGNPPPWVDHIARHTVKEARHYYLKLAAAHSPVMKNFWVQPYLLAPRIDGGYGMDTLRPAVVVLEIPISRLPTRSLTEHISSLSIVANYWAGGAQHQAAKRWCLKHLEDPDHVYLMVSNLSHFTFTASPQALAALVDRLMLEGGIDKRYRDFAGTRLIEHLSCKPGEDLSRCIERILDEVFSTASVWK
ncbi:MAG: hypothetical protein ABW068_09110 [Candidatus Thiodiazotropha sp.]